jgi:thiol-disulfide isomerase/thioredoxin
MFSNFDKQFGPKFSFDGQEAVAAALRKEELMALSQTGNTPRLQALLKKLAASSNPEVAEIADEYRQMQERVAALKSKPMDLKFTAVDGTTVDVSKLRGKVVLVDFWATWCGPCVEEVPEIVDIYQKYHAKGFEVVGISLDQDKDTMLAFTKEHGMTWPQYFDGEGWDNKISKSFGIGAIPAMWLLDKKGMLSATDDAMNGSDLADQVEKLLAAP